MYFLLFFVYFLLLVWPSERQRACRVRACLGRCEEASRAASGAQALRHRGPKSPIWNPVM